MTAHSDRTPFDLTIFDQDTHWTGADGYRHVITDLDPTDRADLVAWLLRNAEHFYLRVLTQALFDVANPDVPRVPGLTFKSAEDWMRQTPLVLALAGREPPHPVGQQTATTGGRRRALVRLLRR